MTPRTLLALALLTTFLSGCIGGAEEPADPIDEPATTPDAPGPQIIEWQGHIFHSQLDILAHFKDPEGVIYPIQQAGFLVEIEEVPEAIEVMVSWDAADAGFRLHPHYTAHHDPALAGDTLYYGYLSEMYQTSPGCVRIPAADMAAGTWPMMIHPQQGTMDVDYTITVGIVGAEGVVLDDMHGHRLDDDAPVEDHGIEPCSFLVETAEEEADEYA